MILDVRFEELNVTFATSFEENDNPFAVLFEESDVIFSIDFGEVTQVYGEVPKYEGTYEATPKVVGQSLPTAQKFLARDVTINKIPYYEVQNSSGGDTVYIGIEV